MTARISPALALAVVLATTGALAHDDRAAGTRREKLGQVSFSVSCSASAQARFHRAMALYHSFYWSEAQKAFRSVLAADPDCAMAQWGLALNALGNPFAWPPAVTEAAAELAKAKAMGAKTERERDYIAALDVFLRDADTLSHKPRHDAFERAMAQLAQKYPQDTEAQVLYALVLSSNYDPTDKKYVKQLAAARILEPIFARLPEHPGVAHYIIHSYDYPPIAQHGLDAARRYAKIAETAPHALHMPSHIFTRLGYWEDSISSNQASAAAAGKEMSSRRHAQDYMVYAYLQLGQDAAARRLHDEALQMRKYEGDSGGMAYSLAAMPARIAVERGAWGEAARLVLGPEGFPWQKYPNAEALLVYARAIGRARTGDPAGARSDVARLAELNKTMQLHRMDYWAEQAQIQARAATAWALLAEGKSGEAIAQMRAAADLEDATEKSPVSPGPLLPARELLGEMLLELRQPAQALAEFELTMRKEPNRFRGLYGGARAAEAAGDRDKAKDYYARLTALAAKADSPRPELAQAKTFLAQR